MIRTSKAERLLRCVFSYSISALFRPDYKRAFKSSGSSEN